MRDLPKLDGKMVHFDDPNVAGVKLHPRRQESYAQLSGGFYFKAPGIKAHLQHEGAQADELPDVPSFPIY